MSGPADCIFCKIVRGETDAHVVHEDDHTLIFMDIFPVAPGHSLIIPKAHSESIFETDTRDLQRVMAHSKRLAQALRDEFAPDGIGVYQLNGAAAGQTVFHYHMHLIPRKQGDPLALHGRAPGDPQQLALVASRLKDALARVAG